MAIVSFLLSYGRLRSSCITYVFWLLPALFEYYGYHLNCDGLYIQPQRQFMGCVYPYIDGLLVVYTVSEVDLNSRTHTNKPFWHLNQPPIQYIQLEVRQYTDTHIP